MAVTQIYTGSVPTYHVYSLTDIAAASREHAYISEGEGGGSVVCADEVVTGYSHPNISKVVEVRNHYLNFIVTTVSSLYHHCLHNHHSSAVQVGCVCNNAQIRDGQVLGDPMEGAMLAVGHKLKLFSIRDQFVRTDERAFSSERKWMAVHVRSRTALPTDVSYQNERALTSNGHILSFKFKSSNCGY